MWLNELLSFILTFVTVSLKKPSQGTMFQMARLANLCESILGKTEDKRMAGGRG